MLFQTPDFSPWHMRRVVELLRVELLISMLGRSDGDRWWDHMHQ